MSARADDLRRPHPARGATGSAGARSGAGESLPWRMMVAGPVVALITLVAAVIVTDAGETLCQARPYQAAPNPALPR